MAIDLLALDGVDVDPLEADDQVWHELRPGSPIEGWNAVQEPPVRGESVRRLVSSNLPLYMYMQVTTTGRPESKFPVDKLPTQRLVS